ncbi:T9SS type A sorting domain-containing protein [Winogradskyella forsetii]|uniref:T9SS type A sorting domain-containing protein n=1 Tax=Winogradskyella forsetii TaxID=2686077 RepID=UPI0015BC9944|nr:T9SS type A sorting domain-containing protein [Winogradskyella forsetii]
MTNKVLFSVVLFLFSIHFLEAQTTAIPDANFENYLETHSADGAIVALGDANSMGDGIANNNLVLTASISEVLLLDISGLGISNLSGIQDFAALNNLFCSDNNLESLDISNISNLVSLLCGSNSLADLDVSSNSNLETLNFADNQIQNIDLSNNTALKSLTASGNQLLLIDVSNNMELSSLSVSNNRIEGELDVSNNSNLESLYCASNQISTLNLSANPLLKNLDASGNALTDLDLSVMNSVVCPDPQTDPVTVCQGLSTINVSNNLLNALVVTNGYNNLVSFFNASDNPDLFCIQIDNGFTPSGWIKDDWTYFSENTCEDIYTYIPDDNFEQALINDGHDDILDNLVLTENIDALTSLDVSNESISSLVGIEDFSALEILDCSTNSIESLDLSNNTELIQIDVTNNNLTTLDLSTNTAFTTLYCASNMIEHLDLSTNLALTTINCSNNNLTNLDVSTISLLSNFDCSFNQIESLNLVSNTALVSVLCNDNNLFALNINNGNNTTITTFNATNNNNLFCIQVDDETYPDIAGWQKDLGASYNVACGTYIPDDNFEQELIDVGIDSDGTLNNFVATTDINTLIALDISNLAIADLTGIQDFEDLIDLNISYNELTNIDLSNNTDLEILDCSNNEITDLDLTLNTALTSLLCNDNSFLTLNIENGNNGALTTFNATNNSNLYCINVDDAIVGNILGTWQKDDFAAYNGDCVSNRVTAIPDGFFEQSLIDFGYDDVLDGEVKTANIEHIQNLDVSDKSISDLTGIQDFRSLVELDCSGNFLNTLDVSDMLFLERLNCSSNYLLTNDTNDIDGLFNTTGTISLKALYCAGNNLNNLDTSQNTNLEILDCADNNISDLNINNNALLRVLYTSNNDLTILDLSSNTALEDVNCDSNQISNLTTIGTINTTLINLSCANNDIINLSVNNYQALEVLNVSSNELTQLNVDNNAELVFLSITNNQISEISLLNNGNLVEVLASQNSLQTLDLSANALLEFLNCDFNELTALNLVSNPSLESLSCSNNQLTELDLLNNGNLIAADFSSNMISSVILPNNLEFLKRLDASNNQIENDLDLTAVAISACVFQPNQIEFCPENISINVSNNLLSFVNIQNGINTEIASFNASGNPNLECIQVDDADNVNVSWIKDEATTFSEDCNFGETYVPDDNFEQALIDLGYDSGPLNDYVLTANIVNVVSLEVNGNTIADLTGIEDFAALQTLNCSNNAIIELDLSSNSNLLEVDCSDNLLTDLDLTTNIALMTLNCAFNSISTLDLTANANLSDLNMSYNTLTSFLPSDVLSLQVFNCDNNSIVTLDFQQNQNLTSISCESNLLETLNIKNGQNTLLTNLNAINNPNLLCIETDNGTVPNGATWDIDATAQFAINCFFGETYVPDDNFEQALIDLGYDSGPLNDYVFTENIEDVEFLNISNREISDLIGIEDFISLTQLNIEGNTIAAIDLSNNLQLVNLNASNNLLAEIDVTFLLNLTDLDMSNNALTAINLDSNLSLLDVDVSTNLITELNVDGLLNLEDLNCSSNQLSSLSVVQNTNLKTLFCQSNLLIGDQLNIQNGNNENIFIFNATDNPDLGCILVDNPLAVVENLDGFYDSWFKDNSASYQTICDDADNDGVPNTDDLCPNTEFGAAVDLFGCAIPDLQNDNFTVLITGETCLNSNNGKITITAQEIYNYTATLIGQDILDGTGEVFYQEYNFTNDVDIFNLLADTYEMCVTIEEWPDYQSCYTIVITEPNPLSVFASRPASGSDVTLDMSGSTIYYIQLNDDTYTTHNSTFTLQLQQGVNQLKVSTDLDCQGVFEEQIMKADEPLLFPNPFKNELNIYDGNVGDEVTVKMYSTFGQLVLTKTFINQGVYNAIDTEHLATGMYLMSIQTKSETSTFKIVKK